MESILHTVMSAGNSGFHLFWFPILIWTSLTVTFVTILRLRNNVHALIHYHLRTSMLLALPFALFISILLYVLQPSLSIENLFPNSFLTIHTSLLPGAVESIPNQVNEGNSLNLLSFWSGVGIVFIAIGSVINMIRLLVNHFKLNGRLKKINFYPLNQCSQLSQLNVNFEGSMHRTVRIGYSHKTEVPFTAGIRNPVIVLPATLVNHQKQMNMAVRHELIHIKRQDYLINILLLIVKSIFWIHPFVHKLYRDYVTFCEISCDCQVLLEQTISPRGYAFLLYDLAGKNHPSNFAISQLAVKTSTLTKRIYSMNQSATKSTPHRKSMIASIACFVLITGLISCTEIQGPEVIEPDLTDMTTKLESKQKSDDPLMIIDDKEISEYEDIKLLISKIQKAAEENKIESVHIIKGEAALTRFGSKGKNGVIEISLKKHPIPPPPPPSKGDSQK